MISSRVLYYKMWIYDIFINDFIFAKIHIYLFICMFVWLCTSAYVRCSLMLIQRLEEGIGCLIFFWICSLRQVFLWAWGTEICCLHWGHAGHNNTSDSVCLGAGVTVVARAQTLFLMIVQLLLLAMGYLFIFTGSYSKSSNKDLHKMEKVFSAIVPYNVYFYVGY